MSVIDAVTDIVTPIASSLGLDVYDIDMAGPILRVSLDRPGGVDLDLLAEANRLIGAEIDLVDPIPGRYTLEVSSPGLERRLRTPRHWQGAVGERVKVKLRRESGGVRRLEGTVIAAAADHVEIRSADDGTTQRVMLDDISGARTAFEWGPAPKPGSGERATASSRTDRTISSGESETS